ncbi:NUDIX hydrolase [Tersicoccus sp. MR15.9]|uniref:NUDIX hydrolase n=1 Tax=Tersicoccus mangrovi TaxID=3121635 RepID=UPI002FE5E1AC
MTTEQSPGWRRLDSRLVHDGRMRVVRHGVQLPTGERIDFEVDESVPAAAATLVLDGADVLLTRQFRYPIGRTILDLPGGGVEPGESPESAARREMIEEIGRIPLDLVPLHRYFANPGRARWAVHLFFCTATAGTRAGDGPDTGSTTTERGATAGTEPSEQVQLARVPLVELDDMITTGQIVDPSLLVARLMAAATGRLPAVGTRLT